MKANLACGLLYKIVGGSLSCNNVVSLATEITEMQ